MLAVCLRLFLRNVALHLLSGESHGFCMHVRPALVTSTVSLAYSTPTFVHGPQVRMLGLFGHDISR